MREQLVAGRYRVIDRLGSGGMATVLLAEDQVLGRRVALKHLHPHGADELVSRLAREARIGASLNHPNVVRTFDVLTGDEGSWIVMEHVDGGSLAEALRAGPLPPARAVRLLREVASALDHAHERGVVHRDVKPANVLLRRDGRAKLADLGIAMAADQTRITTTGAALGSVAYMAPEQLDGRPVTSAADVHALAAVAFEVLTGRRARAGGTAAELAARAARGGPPDLRDAWPEAPAGLDEVLARGMAADPDARHPTARAFVDELALVLGVREVAAAGVAPPASEGSSLGDADDHAEPAAAPVPGATAPLPSTRRPPRPPREEPVAARTPRPAPARAAARATEPERAAMGGRPGRALPVLLAVLVLLAGGLTAALLGGGDDGSRAERATTTAGGPAAGSGEDDGDGAAGSEPGGSAAGGAAAGDGSGDPGGAAAGDGSGSGSSSAGAGGAAAGGGSGSGSGGGSATGGGSAGTAEPAAGPAAAVRALYTAAAAQDRDGVCARLGPTLRARFSCAGFTGQFRTLQAIEFAELEPTRQQGDAATVALRTTARHTDRTERCRGTVRVVRRDGRWLVDGLDVSCRRV